MGSDRRAGARYGLRMDALYGTWLLDRFVVDGPHGQRQPFGPDATGVIVYGADGGMSAILSRPIAGAATLETAHRLSIEDKAAAFDRILAYAGRWRVEGDTVVHSVLVGLAPGVVGTELRRRFAFDGDRLVLSYTLEGRSGPHRFTLTWRRA